MEHMLHALHSITLWSATAATCLISAGWQGLVLTTGIALCLRLLPGLSAAGRSRLWMAALLLVVLLHLAPLTSLDHGLPSLDQNGAFRFSLVWGCLLAGAWALLSIFRVAQLALGVWRVRRIAQSAAPVACSAKHAALLGSGRRPVELCTSPQVDRPSVIGFRFPRILMPPALMAELSAPGSAADLEQIILHELEHLRRADDWTNLVQKLVLALFPLNPALLWIERRLCTERELACDDGVLGQTHARKAYASCLTRLAEHSLISRGASLALNAWERQTELSRRVYRILLQPETGARTRPGRLVTSLLGIALLAGAGELARSPQLVSFAPAPLLTASLVTGSVLPTLVNPGSAHLELARMVMPETGAHSASHIVRPLLARPARGGKVSRQPRTRTTMRMARSNGYQQRLPLAAPAQWLVLTRYQQSNPAASLRLAVDDNFLPSYAAVRVVNGWLIVEL